MVKQRCCSPCCKPLLEALCALESFAGTLLEPPFYAGTAAGTHAGTPGSTIEALPEPTFLRFWSFLAIRHSVGPCTT